MSVVKDTSGPYNIVEWAFVYAHSNTTYLTISMNDLKIYVIQTLKVAIYLYSLDIVKLIDVEITQSLDALICDTSVPLLNVTGLISMVQSSNQPGRLAFSL